MRVVIGHPTRDQVLFAGPFGVGKTTALRIASEIAVADTDTASSEAAALGLEDKDTTTVGFDYGEWVSGSGIPVSLVGVPGQERFEAMWDTLMPRSSAVVLWLYGDRHNALQVAREWLDSIALRQALTRLTLAITRIPPGDDAALAAYRALAAEYHPMATVAVADPRDRADVDRMLEATLHAPLAALERKQHEQP